MIELASIDEWGEDEPCLWDENLRIPFEEFMRWEFSKPGLESDKYRYYNLETEIRFQSFCLGALFMGHHRSRT